MRRTTFGVILTSGLVAVIAAAAIAEDRGPGKMRGEGFRAEMMAAHLEKVDADKDGKISKAEAEAFKKARFTEADADRNGRLTQAELQAFHEAERARRKAERQAYMFNKADTDGDGGLSEAEFMATKPNMFDRMDRDHDGFIEPDEFGRRHHGKRK